LDKNDVTATDVWQYKLQIVADNNKNQNCDCGKETLLQMSNGKFYDLGRQENCMMLHFYSANNSLCTDCM
jgi:hypothetical protein